jgi:hypothetical protein
MSNTSLEHELEEKKAEQITDTSTSRSDLEAIEEQSPIIEEEGINEKTIVLPDGGATAWLVVLGAFCCGFSGPGWLNSKCPRTIHQCLVASSLTTV